MNPSINWNTIETVLLDMDGTILDLGFDNYFWLQFIPEVYARENNLSIEESKAFLSKSYAAIEGKLQWYCLDFWSEKLELDIPALKYSVRERVAFRPGALKFLQFLTKQAKQTILVTNAHPKSLEIKLLTAEFHQYFDDLNSSHELGFPKEDQAYWRLLQDKYQFNLETTLFVDDSVRILKAARAFGIANVYGIAQPDLGREKIDCSPFEAIHQFEEVIQYA